MKNRLPTVLLPALGLLLALPGRAEPTPDVNPGRPDAPSRRILIRKVLDDADLEKAPVTFLGVETAPAGPALASQLGLPGGTGLVVARVIGDSPASAVLKTNDLLTKIDDQILVDSRQLSVLVRAHKEGDEVTLTLFRGGKVQTVKVKLGQREMPVRVGMEDPGPGSDAAFQVFNGEDLPDRVRLRELPGLGREDVDNVLHMIGREHGNWFGAPPVHMFSHEGGKASTILDLAQGNFVFSDDNGSVEVNAGSGRRELTVKNARGDVTFKGSINSEQDRKTLPPEVVARLSQIEKMDVRYEPGEDFDQEATAIAPPGKTKISAPPGAWRPAAKDPLLL